MRARKLLALGVAVLALGLVVAACGGDDNGGSSSSSSGSSSSSSGGGDTIKIAMLSDCEGDFGSFFEPTAAGFNMGFINGAGAKASGSKPTDGLDGATIGGKKLQFVGYGCSDATADKAVEETRRLMEQEDADILIGPLSGDEGIAVANYAKEHPDKTFINGIAGAQDATLKVQAPNFFRFHPDGAQWSAGLGDYAYNTLKWKTAAIIGDDYSFPYTSLAGFVAEFCSIGGQVTKRIWAPLGEKDYSSFISQIPKDVDGVYVGIGGSGLVSFIKQYKQVRGRVDTERMLGNVFWDDPLVLKEVGKDLVGGATSAMTAADDDSADVKQYTANLKNAYGAEIAATGPSVFTYGYFTASTALVKALKAVNGDISDQKKLQDALASTTLSGAEAPWGPFRLRVFGRSGHASMPGIADNALVKAAPLIQALGAYTPEQQLIPEVEALLETVTGVRPTSPSEVLEQARGVAPLLAEMVEPLLSMTLSPTMANASQKRNVIPATCDITVDSRLLPGTTVDEQQAIVQDVLGKGDYELISLEAHGGTRSDIRTPLWDAVSSWVESVDPGAKPAPICVAGFTDSHWFRKAFGTVAYGFFPSRVMPIETAARLIHSADERVPVEDLELGVGFLRHAAQSLLSG